MNIYLIILCLVLAYLLLTSCQTSEQFSVSLVNQYLKTMGKVQPPNIELSPLFAGSVSEGVIQPMTFPLKYLIPEGQDQPEFCIIQLDVSGRKIWAVADTGSGFPLFISDECNCGDPKKYGYWPVSSPGEIPNSGGDWTYGSGKYEGAYWRGNLDKAPFNFGAITKVISQQSSEGDTPSVCGLVPYPEGATKTSKYSFLTQVYKSLSAGVPRSIITDFKNMELTIGKIDHGEKVRLATLQEFRKITGGSWGFLPFYVVFLKSLLLVTSSGEHINIPHPPLVFLDSGTTVSYAVFNPKKYPLPNVNETGTLIYEFEGLNGGSVRMAADMAGMTFSGATAKTPTVPPGMGELCICGLWGMMGNIISWVDGKYLTVR